MISGSEYDLTFDDMLSDAMYAVTLVVPKSRLVEFYEDLKSKGVPVPDVVMPKELKAFVQHDMVPLLSITLRSISYKIEEDKYADCLAIYLGDSVAKTGNLHSVITYPDSLVDYVFEWAIWASEYMHSYGEPRIKEQYYALYQILRKTDLRIICSKSVDLSEPDEPEDNKSIGDISSKLQEEIEGLL